MTETLRRFGNKCEQNAWEGKLEGIRQGGGQGRCPVGGFVASRNRLGYGMGMALTHQPPRRHENPRGRRRHHRRPHPRHRLRAWGYLRGLSHRGRPAVVTGRRWRRDNCVGNTRGWSGQVTGQVGSFTTFWAHQHFRVELCLSLSPRVCRADWVLKQVERRQLFQLFQRLQRL